MQPKTLSLLRDMGKMLPIDTLRTVVSAMSGSDAETAGDSHQAAIRSGIRITACAPTILAAHFAGPTVGHIVRDGDGCVFRAFT